MANTIALDELTKKLIADGKKTDNVIMVYGFVGEGPKEDTITFYLDPLLKTSVVVQNEDVIHHVKITKTHSAIGGTIIWIKNASSYTHTNNQKPQQEAAQFFQGAIYQQYVNATQNNNTIPQQQGINQPVCGCGTCGQQ